MPPEEWRTAPGWAAYKVSSRGRVRSVDRVLTDGRGAGGKLLKPRKDKDGYRRVVLVDGARRWDVHVARLVLFAFEGWPDDPAMEACHRNGRRWDNCWPRNLYWGTKPENRQERERHRRERAARRAAETVTEVTDEAGETGGAEPCQSKVDSGKVDMCRSAPWT